MAWLVRGMEKDEEDEEPALAVVSCRRLGIHHIITLSDGSTWQGRGSWWWHTTLNIGPPAYVQHILCREAARAEKESAYV